MTPLHPFLPPSSKWSTNYRVSNIISVIHHTSLHCLKNNYWKILVSNVQETLVKKRAMYKKRKGNWDIELGPFPLNLIGLDSSAHNWSISIQNLEPCKWSPRSMIFYLGIWRGPHSHEWVTLFKKENRHFSSSCSSDWIPH